MKKASSGNPWCQAMAIEKSIVLLPGSVSVASEHGSYRQLTSSGQVLVVETSHSR